MRTRDRCALCRRSAGRRAEEIQKPKLRQQVGEMPRTAISLMGRLWEVPRKRKNLVYK